MSIESNNKQTQKKYQVLLVAREEQMDLYFSQEH